MIRNYKDTDVESVVSIWRAANELAHPFLTKEFLDEESHNVRNVYPAFAEIWVTEIDGRVVGFIALVETEIGGLFLDTAYHGQGLGRAMVDKAVAEKGALTVEVFRDNTIARPFYEAYGFHYVDEYVHEASGQVTLRMTYSPE